MSRKQAIILLDSELMDIQVNCEKAIAAAAVVAGECFGDTNPDPDMLKYYYNHFQMLSSIVLDYVCEAKKTLDKIREEAVR